MKKGDFVLLLAYCAACYAGILNHELWLDEAHHWLLARDSNSVSELLMNMRYDGHPVLWNMMLFIITRFTHNPLWMQLVHGAIAIGAVFIFLKEAPFNFFQKLLFISGYFVLYEYSVISRNYSLLLLLIFAITALISKEKKLFALIGLLLGILANVHLFGCIVAISFALYLFLVEFKKPTQKVEGGQRIIGGVLFVTGLILCVIQIIPPTDSPFVSLNEDSSLLQKIETASSGFVKALIPLPDFTDPHFWNTNWLIVHAKPVAITTTILLFFVPILLLQHRIDVLFFYLLSIAGILLFIFIAGIASQRYFGLIYILLIVALWMAKGKNASLPFFKTQSITEFFSGTVRNYVLMILLLLQVVCGLVAFVLDIQKPFSSGRETAEYFQSKYKDDYELITTHVAFPSLCAYAGKKMFILSENGPESFVYWQRDFSMKLEENELMEMAVGHARGSTKRSFLVTDRLMKVPDQLKNDVLFLKKIGPGVVRTEVFFIYQINP